MVTTFSHFVIGLLVCNLIPIHAVNEAFTLSMGLSLGLLSD